MIRDTKSEFWEEPLAPATLNFSPRKLDFSRMKISPTIV